MRRNIALFPDEAPIRKASAAFRSVIVFVPITRSAISRCRVLVVRGARAYRSIWFPAARDGW
jgi:hypothetical protein